MIRKIKEFQKNNERKTRTHRKKSEKRLRIYRIPKLYNQSFSKMEQKQKVNNQNHKSKKNYDRKVYSLRTFK